MIPAPLCDNLLAEAASARARLRAPLSWAPTRPVGAGRPGRHRRRPRPWRKLVAQGQDLDVLDA